MSDSLWDHWLVQATAGTVYRAVLWGGLGAIAYFAARGITGA